MEEQLQSSTESSLWLMFELQEGFYAVDCRYVESIFEIMQEIIPVPRTDESILGLIELRGATAFCCWISSRFYRRSRRWARIPSRAKRSAADTDEFLMKGR